VDHAAQDVDAGEDAELLDDGDRAPTGEPQPRADAEDVVLGRAADDRDGRALVEQLKHRPLVGVGDDDDVRRPGAREGIEDDVGARLRRRAPVSPPRRRP